MRMQTRHCAGHREAVHPTPTSRVAPLAASAHNAACRQSRRHQVQHRGTGVAWLPGIAVRRSSACRVASAATDVISTAPEPQSAPSTSGQERPDVVAVLRERGLIQDVTSDALQKAALADSLSVYCGFDPTADSLHLGNLLGIIVLSWFQRCGHQPVALLGGATGRVGDPSGRSTERPILSEEQIERNVAGIRALLERILSRSGSVVASSGNGVAVRQVQVVNNLDWFGPMSFLTFLREVGKFARVSTMLSKDSVKSRMESESGISFTEFTYQLLQGYDFVHLCREKNVRVQVGGSDQWGNIVAGTELIRKLLGRGESDADQESSAPQCYGLTFPLLVDSEGRKFGKSVDGAVWLSADKLSPYKFYQHLFNVPDADVIKFIKMLTFVPMSDIATLEESMRSPSYVPNTAQRRLAEEVTRFVHGEEGLAQALKATEALRPGAATTLDAATLEAVAGDAPSATLDRAQVENVTVAELLVTVKLQPSKGAARKLIKGGGVYVNNVKIQEELGVVSADQLIEGKMLLLAAGKKNKMLIRVQ